jgi:hypothetical protein
MSNNSARIHPVNAISCALTQFYHLCPQLGHLFDTSQNSVFEGLVLRKYCLLIVCNEFEVDLFINSLIQTVLFLQDM